MKKFQLRNLLIFLPGLVIFEYLSVFSNILFAQDLNKNKYKIRNLNNLPLDVKKNKKITKSSNGIFLDKYEVLKDIKANGEKLFTLLAFEQKVVEDEFFAEIDSDIQYREEGIFYAEGNAIIFLSNATLQGDSIQYDLENKLLTVVGNVVFKKGEQYFEASKLFYDLRNDTGYIDDVYGLLDSKTFSEDFKLQIDKSKEKKIEQEIKNEVNLPRFTNTATIGLVNQFEEDKVFNITKADLKIPTISRWRYKTDKLVYNSETLDSKKIFFTNDIYNEPQFVFLSKNFSAEIKENKLRLLSRNSWIILDDKLKIPIGRRSVFDKDPLTKWGFGADYKDKDGYFLFRSTYPREIFKDYTFQIQPYFLIQRAIQGNTKSYTSKDSTIFSEKVKSDIKFSDYFALDLIIKGKENEWDIDSKIQLNSLNTERLDESLRSKLTLSKRIDLNNKKDNEIKLKTDIETNNFIGFNGNNISPSRFNNDPNLIKLDSPTNENFYNNFLDFQFYNIFRERVVRDFDKEEIYFASGFNFANRKSWLINDKKTNFALIYDFGHFKSKSSKEDEFNELFRNTFVAQYKYKFPIWKKAFLDESIDENYKFSPVVIKQSFDWSIGLQSGLFLYSDGSNQIATRFNTGPSLTIGSLKKKLLDYTFFGADFNYVIKEGNSPFTFDNINKDPRINFILEQQIYGPLIFSFKNSVNLDNGKYSKPFYALDFKRRAYSVGAFYNSNDESLGITFNIYNFDYSGLKSKF